MPKFYHGKCHGIQYKARAVGFWRRFPFRFLPYFTGDIIQIRLSLKPLVEGQQWQQGVLHVEPPVLTKGEPQIVLSDNVFAFVEWWPMGTPPKYQFPLGKWWSRTLSLKSGVSFGQPCNIKCTLILQNIDDGIEETAPIPIVDFEIKGRDSFRMWLFTSLMMIVATLTAIIALILNLLR